MLGKQKKIEKSEHTHAVHKVSLPPNRRKNFLERAESGKKVSHENCISNYIFRTRRGKKTF